MTDFKTNFEKILAKVSKPTRYVGNEWNSVHKDRCQMSDARSQEIIRVALAFPDIYEVGMSHLGMNILYHLLNSLEDTVAERVYAPWIDMEQELRENKIPLLSLESNTPVKEFDIIGFSLQYEMCYTNVLNMLDLAGIPVFSDQRDDSYPLVIAGGACAFNPEPMAAFIDLFVIGEAEESLAEIVSEWRSGRAAKLSKQEILKKLVTIEGVYVPCFYDVTYNEDGTINSFLPKVKGVPLKIKKRIVQNLEKAFCPEKPIVPFQSIVHDRAVLEIMRGCSQGCRFCHAGMIARPVRMRSADFIKKQAEKIIENTGWEKISFLGLNVSDHPGIEEIVYDVSKKYSSKGVSVSLPSLRPDKFSIELAGLVSTQEKAKPTLTFAPEAGTQRLRDAINKKVSKESLIESINTAFKAGWDSCKLYFMVGLPTETDEDVDGIAGLVKEVRSSAKKINSRATFRVSVSPFSPKAHTPFQWEAQDPIETLKLKQKKILNGLKGMEIRWNRPQLSFLEAILSLGDRKISKVIFNVWKKGIKIDAWEESSGDRNFLEKNFFLWQKAFEEENIDPDFYVHRKKSFQEILPWDHIECGVTKEFLIKENKNAGLAVTTANCVFEGCQGCGVCGEEKFAKKFSWEPQKTNIEKGKIRAASSDVRQRVRIKFEKGKECKNISHLDLCRLFLRVLLRADIPVAFSRSYHKHAEIAMALPLSVGTISDCELCEVLLSSRIEPAELEKRLKNSFPEGIKVKEIQEILISSPVLPNVVDSARYEIKAIFTKEMNEPIIAGLVKDFMDSVEVIVRRITPKTDKKVNIRPLVENITFVFSAQNECLFNVVLKTTHQSGAKPQEVIKEILKDNFEITSIVRKEIMLKS